MSSATISHAHDRRVGGSTAAASHGSTAFRAWTLASITSILTSVVAIALLGLAALTAFRARRLYAGVATRISRVILRLYGVRLRVHQAAPFPRAQTIYISNHSSTLDLFILVALGLPNCRFFLSGFLRKLVPLGIISWLMGTFFTVPQDRRDERARIFARAERALRRTRESVYLSPEGGRITTGEIGHFNKGAFHLATNLQVPIVPMYFRIPPHVDPGMGYHARPGTVDVYVLPPVDTREWKLDDLLTNRDYVRNIFVRAHQELRCS